jgi:ribonuclease J
MMVRIHRGAKQIGGTCIELACSGTRIALDLGLPLDGDSADQSLLPWIAGPDLAAVLISHPHLDHYGLLHHLPADVPIAMGDAARRIVRAAAPFTGQSLPNLDGPILRDRTTFEIGPFRITPFLVDHSAFDAYSLLIEAAGKRIFYSGDFRAHGRKAALFERMIAHPPNDIDVLLMEGSSLSRLDDDGEFPTEGDLERTLVDKLRATNGLMMVHTSAQNIDRIVTLFNVAKKTNRILIVDLYSAAILAATGHPSIPKSSWPGVALYVPETQRRQIKQHGWFDLLKVHSAHRVFADDLPSLAPNAIILYRPLLMRDLSKGDCLAGARFIYSQWRGYLEQGSYATTQDWLKRNGIDLEYVHTSGHASPVDLKRFGRALAPKALVPIHSFAPEKYPKLFDNVTVHYDGEWWNA